MMAQPCLPECAVPACLVGCWGKLTVKPELLYSPPLSLSVLLLLPTLCSMAQPSHAQLLNTCVTAMKS